jgi:hypothetical protein
MSNYKIGNTSYLEKGANLFHSVFYTPRLDIRDTSVGDSEVPCFGRLPEIRHLLLGHSTQGPFVAPPVRLVNCFGVMIRRHDIQYERH